MNTFHYITGFILAFNTVTIIICIKISTCVTYASLLNHVKFYDNIARDSFFLLWFIHFTCHNPYISGTESRQKTYHLTSEPMREQNAFHMKHIPPILRLATMEYFYLKLRNTKLYNHSKQVAMSASDYTEMEYRDVRMLMQIKQYYLFIRHFNDV